MKFMKTSSRKDLLQYINDNPVFAFNFNDVIDLQGIVNGIQKYNTPVILMVSPAAVNYLGLDYLKAIFDVAKKRSQTPIYIQLDHAKDKELISSAIKLDFDLIMIDRLNYDDASRNIEEIAEATLFAQSQGILVEGEIGIETLNSNENMPFVRPFHHYELHSYVKKTSVDLIAIPCGNKHGFSRIKPPIDIEWLNDISNVINTPLVLHGADFVEKEELSKAISAGIRKINIGPELRVEYYHGIKNLIYTIDELSPDHRILMDKSRKLIQEKIEKRITEIYK